MSYAETALITLLSKNKDVYRTLLLLGKYQSITMSFWQYLHVLRVWDKTSHAPCALLNYECQNVIEFTRLSPHTTRDRKLGDVNEAWLALSVVSAVKFSQQWPGH